MIQIAEHVYAVGNTELITVMKDQQDALHYHSSERIQMFNRLCKSRVMHNCTKYTSKRCSKRNNTYCMYERDGNHFGQIIFFAKHPKPGALIKELFVV